MAVPEVYPKAAVTVSVAKTAELLAKLLAMADRVHSGYAMVGESTTSLGVTIQEGVAIIGGKQVGRAGDGSNAINLSSTPNATNYIYVQDNGGTGVISSNTTGVLPGGALLLWTIQTDAEGDGLIVGTKTDKRDSFRVNLQAGLIIDDLKLDGSDPAITNAKHLDFDAGEPYIRLKDTVTGKIIRLWARGNKLQVTDDAGSTIHTDDLSNLALNFTAIAGTITDGQHGNRGGGALHANATGGAAGFMSAADKTIIDAATDAATASALAKRDGAGRLKIVDGSAASDAATKGQVDTVQTNLTTHQNDQSAHGATAARTANAIVKRTSQGGDVNKYAQLDGGDEAIIGENAANSAVTYAASTGSDGDGFYQAGQLIQEIIGGMTVKYRYDNANSYRLLKEIKSWSGGPTETKIFSYDGSGNYSGFTRTVA